MGTMAFQITSLTSVYSTVHSGEDQRKHQSSASLAFVQGIHRWPMNSPHKWPVMRKMFAFDDIIMKSSNCDSLKVRWQWVNTFFFSSYFCWLSSFTGSESRIVEEDAHVRRNLSTNGRHDDSRHTSCCRIRENIAKFSKFKQRWPNCIT